MELKQLFRPVKIRPQEYAGIAGAERLGSSIVSLHQIDNVDFFSFKLVIIGIDEGLNSDKCKECGQTPNLVRTSLYGLKQHNSGLRVLDLGNVIGQTIKDKYFVLSEVIPVLAMHNLPVLILGGSQDFTISIMEGLAKAIVEPKLSVVDAVVDVSVDADDLTSGNTIGNLLKNQNNRTNQIHFLGLQKYLLGNEANQILDLPTVDSIRLGDLRGESIRMSEPLLRDAHFVSFDAQVMRSGEMPGQSIPMPNGLSAHEVCQMAWYAGISDSNLGFGLFEINGVAPHASVAVSLAAQMAWIYIDGVLSRIGDFPLRDIETYSIYMFDKEEIGLGLRFFNNPINNRWWVEIETNDKKVLKACSEKDYQLATNKELPEKWWRYVLK